MSLISRLNAEIAIHEEKFMKFNVRIVSNKKTEIA